MEVIAGALAQRRQHRGDAEAHSPGADRRRPAGEALGLEPAQHAQRAVHPLHPAPHPAQRARQLHLGTQTIGGRLEAVGLLDGENDRLDLLERSGQASAQAVREQTERAVSLRATPASDSGARRRLALVGAVAGEPAAAVRMQRAALQSCLAPGLPANVLLAGEPRLEAKLHRPLARTVAAVAGQLLPGLRVTGQSRPPAGYVIGDRV